MEQPDAAKNANSTAKLGLGKNDNVPLSDRLA